MRYQGPSKRKYTGKRLRALRGHRKFQIGSDSLETHIGEQRSKPVRGRGGEWHERLLRAQWANVTDPATGRAQKAEIQGVEGNPANIHFVRRSVISRGAMVRTPLGTAKVTSRPGQDGVVNAVLVKAEQEPAPAAEPEKAEPDAKPKRTRRVAKKPADGDE